MRRLSLYVCIRVLANPPSLIYYKPEVVFCRTVPVNNKVFTVPLSFGKCNSPRAGKALPKKQKLPFSRLNGSLRFYRLYCVMNEGSYAVNRNISNRAESAVGAVEVPFAAPAVAAAVARIAQSASGRRANAGNQPDETVVDRKDHSGKSLPGLPAACGENRYGFADIAFGVPKLSLKMFSQPIQPPIIIDVRFTAQHIIEERWACSINDIF